VEVIKNIEININKFSMDSQLTIRNRVISIIHNLSSYGLSKIHKQDCPLRIIVSCIDSRLYSLTSFLHKIISANVPKSLNNIENSFKLIDKLLGTFIDDNYSLISLDVISLFTNISTDSALDSISKRWCFISKECNIPKDEFLKAVPLILNSSYFTFDNCIYKQIFRSFMDSLLSPIVDLVLRDLEERVLEEIGV